MTELHTTYTIKIKDFLAIWELKYDLNGVLRAFKFVEGELSEKTQVWLFHPKRYPYSENMMKSWKGIKNIEVIVGKPDLSFETFYRLYGKKVGKTTAEKAWNRLNTSDRLLALKMIQPYKKYFVRKHIEQAYPATYLNKRMFEDEFSTVW